LLTPFFKSTRPRLFNAILKFCARSSPILAARTGDPPSGCSFWEWKGQRRQFVSYDREFCIVRMIERDFKHLIDEIAILIQFVEARTV
jgi:hypothetical protein